MSASDFRLIGMDTETTRFRTRETGWNGKTHIKPFGGHEFVCASVYGPGLGEVLGPESTLDFLHSLADDDHLVFHNVSFDVEVMSRCIPGAKQIFIDLIEDGRVHDTKSFECLLRLAQGVSKLRLFDKLTLAALAKRYAGMDLDKNEAVRCDFGTYLGRVPELPSRYIAYAIDDAKATQRVHVHQRKAAEVLSESPSRYPVLPGARVRFGLLGEYIQVKGEVAMAWLSSFPLRVDVPLATATRDRYQVEATRYEPALIEFGYARRKPVKKTFHIRQKELRRALKLFAEARGIVPEYTDTGSVSLKHDFWAQHIPRAAPELLEDPLSAEAEIDKLSIWVRYERVRKLLRTYLNVYASSAVHYTTYHNIGARTTRTSSQKPNVQNIPKRRDGIRGLFIPSPGRRFVETDFVAAELRSLAEVYHLMYGGSRLGDALNAGEDPHVATAKQVFGEDWNRADAATQKNLRQAAKAVNFGLPGGMGAAKFADFARGYGIFLDLDAARHLRGAALAGNPELCAYLRDEGSEEDRVRLAARNLHISVDRLISILDAWRNPEEGTVFWHLAALRLRKWIKGTEEYAIPVPRGYSGPADLFRTTTRTLTGLVRGRAIYTEARNTPFQGPVADIGKLAVWNLYRKHSFKSAWDPVCFVHDSIMIEADEGYEASCQKVLETCMLEAMRTITPHIQPAVETEIKDRWGSLKDAQGQVIAS